MATNYYQWLQSSRPQNTIIKEIKYSSYDKYLFYLPEQIENLKKVKNLSIEYTNFTANTNLTDFENEPFTMDKQINVRSLNNIHKTNITQFELHDCILPHNCIPPSINLQNFSKLTLLSIVESTLLFIPKEIRFLVHLEYLDLQFNQISNICNELLYLTNIDTILINNNNIRIIPNFFENFEKLEKLVIDANPLVHIPEQLIRKSSEHQLEFLFDDDEDNEFDGETTQWINEYVPLNQWFDVSSWSTNNSPPMELTEIIDDIPIIEKLNKNPVPLKKGKPMRIQPDTEIMDFIEGYVQYKNISNDQIIFQNAEQFITVTKDFLQNTKSSSIVYACKQVYDFYDFTEEQLLDKIPYFRLRTLGQYGVVPFDQIVSVIKGNNKTFRIVPTQTQLETVISHEVLYEKGELVSASHCQAGQSETVYQIEVANPIEDTISQRTRKRTRDKIGGKKRKNKQQTNKQKKRSKK
jgi:hypothetical protein